MFNTHQKLIENFARKNPNNMVKVFLMVLLSIQKDWSQIGEHMLDVKAEGVDSKYLYGSKRLAYKQIIKMKKELYDTIFNDEIKLVDKLLLIRSIHGIDLVKGGFVLQLCIGKIGCLDVHNLKRFGLKASTFKTYGNLIETARYKAELYITTCNKLGGCEYLWDNWCEYLATIYPKKYHSANDVSLRHLTYLN